MLAIEPIFRKWYYEKPIDEKHAIITEQLSKAKRGSSSLERNSSLKVSREHSRISDRDNQRGSLEHVFRNSETYQSEAPNEDYTADWFISRIANRKNSPKSLARALINLNTVFTRKGNPFVHNFLKTVVPEFGTNGVSGISCLEVALDRVCLPSLQPATATSSRKHNPAWYSDSTSPDEIRLEVINSLEIIMRTDLGLNFVLNSPGLLRQVFWCLAVPSKSVQQKILQESRLGRAYLHLNGSIFGLFGPTCLLDEMLKEYIIF
jgi:hypothetical protein